jgi:tRNA dimethylallyltransferase
LVDSEPPVIRVICGPTAAGKTSTALACGRVAPISVVSADSRQLYRGFDVGTAKPTPAARRAVPHFGIDVLAPTDRPSAAWWAEQADGWLHAALAAGRTPVVVGGTGLYLRALFGTLFDEPAMDPDRRRALQEELGLYDVPRLRRWVERLDPSRAHLGRTQLLRAIEIALLTGRRMSELHQERRRPPRWRARYLVVDPGPTLAETIRRRTAEMFASGWRDEVRHLMDVVPEDAPAWNASGYGAIRELELGMISQQDAMERVVIETRQYAKRQRTWFRHQLTGENLVHLDPTAPDAEARVAAWWNASGVTA